MIANGSLIIWKCRLRKLRNYFNKFSNFANSQNFTKNRRAKLKEAYLVCNWFLIYLHSESIRNYFNLSAFQNTSSIIVYSTVW